MFLSKPTYYLWKAEFDSQQKFENVKTSLIDSGFRVVVYIDGKIDNDINTAMKCLIKIIGMILMLLKYRYSLLSRVLYFIKSIL